ncbi:MAG: hypothetical protein IJG38_10440 [Thermoguttaceae bacterium]|nr:hypothetical protein [Thermoguttaceae bacterium]MBQ3350807.1 hypothetical protein [Thermoguttaceae bacterium]MBQ6615201.1 hypothetical protein [Thermoguttaceae bacterium]
MSRQSRHEKTPWEQFLETWRNNSPEEKEKRERNEKNAAILLYVILCLVGVWLIVYSILHACGLV